MIKNADKISFKEEGKKLIPKILVLEKFATQKIEEAAEAMRRMRRSLASLMALINHVVK